MQIRALYTLIFFKNSEKSGGFSTEICITSWRAGIFLEECFFSHNYSSICNYYGQIPYRSLLVIREMGHGASLPQAGEEIQQTPVRSLLQVRLKNLVPEVNSVY